MKQTHATPPRGKKTAATQGRDTRKRASCSSSASRTNAKPKAMRSNRNTASKPTAKTQNAAAQRRKSDMQQHSAGPQARNKTYRQSKNTVRSHPTRARSYNTVKSTPRTRVTIVRKSRGRGIAQAALLIAAVCCGVLFFAFGGGRDESIRYLEDIQTSFLQVEADFSGEQTGVTAQDVPLLMDRAAQNAQQLAQDGAIVDYEVGENCVYMQTPDGGGVVYAPTVADEETPAPAQSMTPPQATLPIQSLPPAQSILPTESLAPTQSILPTQTALPSQSPASSQTALPTQPLPTTSARVLCLQPSYDMFLWAFTTQQLEQIDSAAAGFGSLTGYAFDPAKDDLDNAAVDLAAAKSIAGCSVVIWEGHGGHTDTTHSFLFTGQKYTDDFYQKNRDDFINGNLIATTDGYVAVTAGFFETYLPENSLDGALVYLATCSSCRDDTLVRTLLDKGARAVYANDGVIYTIYNYAMLTRISALLCGVQGEPLSTGEALSAAQAEYGYIDNCLLTPNPGAQTNSTTVRLFGDRDMRFDPMT